MPASQRLIAVLALPFLFLPGLACGDDDSDGDAAPAVDDGAVDDEAVEDPDIDPADDPTVDSGADDDADDGETDEDDADDDSDSELEVLEAEEICDAVTAEIVGDATGLEVSQAEISTSSTPQCSYLYETDTGGTSNITVASLSPDDVGGSSGDEAFDQVLEINRTVAGGTDVDEAEIDAGDRAVRLAGQALSLGIVSSGGHLVTIIVPVDIETDAVDALIAAVADAVA